MNGPIIPSIVLDTATSLIELAANWLLQSTVLVAIGFVVVRLLERSGSAFQSAAYRTLLVAVLVCPLATCGLSQFGAPGWCIRFPREPQSQLAAGLTSRAELPLVPSSPADPEPAQEPAGLVEPPPTLADGRISVGALPASPAIPQPSITASAVADRSSDAAFASGSVNLAAKFGVWAMLASLLWVGIALSIYARLALAYRKLNRLRRHAVPVDSSTMRLCCDIASQLDVGAPQVFRSPFLPSPCLAGIRRPAVLLPEIDQSLSLREVLIHELAHLKRHDCHWNLLRQVATATFFFQPLLWMLSRRIELAAEEVCDDYVVALGGDRAEYAHRLVDIAELSCAPVAPACVGIVSFRSMLATRVNRILDTSRTLSTRISNLLVVCLMTVALLATLVVGLIGINPRAMEAVAADGLDTKAGASEEVAPEEARLTLSGRVVGADGRPAGNAMVKIESGWTKKSMTEVKAAADGRFEASVPVKPEALQSMRIRTTSSDGSEIGYYRFSYDNGRTPQLGSLEIKLAKAKDVRIKVVDSKGAPVNGAQVGIQLPFPHTVTGLTTDAAGVCATRIPASDRIDVVVAWKDHLGLDYRSYVLPRGQEVDTNAKPPEFPADGEVTLTLDGATPLTVVLKDEQQRPIENISVYPWLLQKASEPQELNLSLLSDQFSVPSDQEGKAVINWIPNWNKSILQIWPTSSEHAHARGTYDPAVGNGVLEMELVRLVPIRGRVTGPDGKPYAGISVRAQGAGYSWDGGHGLDTTDEDGNYQLMVPPERLYLLVVKDEQWAAAPQDGFVVSRGQPVEGKDFQLRKATHVFGRLLDEETEQPIAGENVLVYQYGQDLSSAKLELPNPENSRRHVQPMEVYSARTDAEGRFAFALGDGRFDIRPPRQEKADPFEITGQTEIEMDVRTKLEKKIELVGKVVARADQTPLSAAQLEGVPQRFSSGDWRATTTADGTFRIERLREPTYVRAASADMQLAGLARLDDQTQTLTMELDAVGSATGRLLATDSQSPLAATKITYGIRVPDDQQRTWSYRFGGTVVTDADGKFRLEHLVPGEEYTLNLEPTPEGVIPTLTKLTVTPGQTIDLKDLPAPAPPKPYVPPTLQDRIRSSFTVAGTPLERLARAGELIQLSNQHLLIVFGHVDDPRIDRLMDIRFNDAEFRPLSDEFRFMAIATENQLRGPAEELAKKLEEPLAEDREKFLIVLLDRDLKKVAAADSSDLCVDGQLSKEKLFDLLREHLTEPLDARELLASALKQAAEEDKRVIVQETATWCGPCYELSGFLDRHREWEKDFIWVKMDHRWTGAVELMAELREGAEGGIPWFAILDASGKKLTTSNDPKDKKNIGFPSEKSGQEHFFNMLNSTRQRMSEADVRSLVDHLAKPPK